MEQESDNTGCCKYCPDDKEKPEKDKIKTDNSSPMKKRMPALAMFIAGGVMSYSALFYEQELKQVEDKLVEAKDELRIYRSKIHIDRASAYDLFRLRANEDMKRYPHIPVGELSKIANWYIDHSNIPRNSQTSYLALIDKCYAVGLYDKCIVGTNQITLENMVSEQVRFNKTVDEKVQSQLRERGCIE